NYVVPILGVNIHFFISVNWVLVYKGSFAIWCFKVHVNYGIRWLVDAWGICAFKYHGGYFFYSCIDCGFLDLSWSGVLRACTGSDFVRCVFVVCSISVLLLVAGWHCGLMTGC